jgi:hypothetical protein
MNFFFISLIDPLLLIPWLCVLGLTVQIVFYFLYFSDIDFPRISFPRNDIKNGKEKYEMPYSGSVEKDLLPDPHHPHPEDNVLDPRNCKDIKVASVDKKEIRKVPCISEVEKDLIPDISRPRPKRNILDPRKYKGIRIIWAIAVTALISIFYACIFAPLECLKACAGSPLAVSMQFCFAFLFSALFPVTIFSFFVIIGERNNKKFLYYSLFVAVSVFLFSTSMFHDFVSPLSLPAILFIYFIN